jgi:two-component SAPR family response regulator
VSSHGFREFHALLLDLAILDIKMPEMNGFSFYREIKKLDKNLRICFLTAGEMYYGVYSDIFSLYLLTISFESLLAMKI